MPRNAAALLLLFACASQPALADPPTPRPLPGVDAPSVLDITKESTRRFLESVRRLTDRSPIYESPRVTRDGDIVIRRVPSPAPSEGEEARAPSDAGGELDL